MGLHQLRTTLATLVTLANRLLSSLSTSNYGRGSWNTTCNCTPGLGNGGTTNRSANLQQKTIEALKRIFWWKKMLFFRLHKKKKTMKMSNKTRTLPQIVVSIFWRVGRNKMCVSPQCQAHSFKKTCFYEHGFRSAGMFMYVYVMDITWYNIDIYIDLNGF